MPTPGDSPRNSPVFQDCPRPNFLRRFHQTRAMQRGRKRCRLKRGGLLPPRAVHSAPQRGSLQGLCWFSRRGSLFRRGGHFGDDFPGKCLIFKLSVRFHVGISGVWGTKITEKRRATVTSQQTKMEGHLLIYQKDHVTLLTPLFEGGKVTTQAPLVSQF